MRESTPSLWHALRAPLAQLDETEARQSLRDVYLVAVHHAVLWPASKSSMQWYQMTGTLISPISGSAASAREPLAQMLDFVAQSNLITHLRKLEDAGYLTSEKTGNGTASRTSIALTGQGRAALDAYTTALRDILDGL